jgi:hypothetical protein
MAGFLSTNRAEDGQYQPFTYAVICHFRHESMWDRIQQVPQLVS